MKLELLVIADQNAAVNAFPGLVHTARHTTGVGDARSRLSNLLEEVVEGGINNWGEVVTRYPYGNVGMDHLLSKEKVQKKKRFSCLVLEGRSFPSSIFEN